MVMGRSAPPRAIAGGKAPLAPRTLVATPVCTMAGGVHRRVGAEPLPEVSGTTEKGIEADAHRGSPVRAGARIGLVRIKSIRLILLIRDVAGDARGRSRGSRRRGASRGGRRERPRWRTRASRHVAAALTRRSISSTTTHRRTVPEPLSKRGVGPENVESMPIERRSRGGSTKAGRHRPREGRE